MSFVEHEFHKEVWKVANSTSQMEEAVKEGRSLAYLILKDLHPGHLSYEQAELWLEKFGRDERREGMRPPDQKKEVAE